MTDGIKRHLGYFFTFILWSAFTARFPLWSLLLILFTVFFIGKVKWLMDDTKPGRLRSGFRKAQSYTDTQRVHR